MGGIGQVHDAAREMGLRPTGSPVAPHPPIALSGLVNGLAASTALWLLALVIWLSF